MVGGPMKIIYYRLLGNQKKSTALSICHRIKLRKCWQGVWYIPVRLSQTSCFIPGSGTASSPAFISSYKLPQSTSPYIPPSSISLHNTDNWMYIYFTANISKFRGIVIFSQPISRNWRSPGKSSSVIWWRRKMTYRGLLKAGIGQAPVNHLPCFGDAGKSSC
jgi:hypothetical protein